MRWRNYENMLRRFHRIPERDERTDRQTDGQTELLYQYRASVFWRASVSILTRDNNKYNCYLYRASVCWREIKKMNIWRRFVIIVIIVYDVISYNVICDRETVARWSAADAWQRPTLYMPDRENSRWQCRRHLQLTSYETITVFFAARCCATAAYAVMRCPSVRLSDTFANSVKTSNRISYFLTVK